MAVGGPPFVLPFETPTLNGANPAKKVKQLNNGRVARINLSPDAVGSLKLALGSKWCSVAPAPVVEPYASLEREVRLRGSAFSRAVTSRLGRAGHAGGGGGDDTHMVAPGAPGNTPESIAVQRGNRSRVLATDAVQRLLAGRRQLPVYAKKSQVLDVALGRSTVSVIGGETGSGKTTQIPQFLLDELIDREGSRGGEIIVTQPRRLAAISVATRVAQERGERIGDSVGYQVRLESVKAQAPCRVSFCTTGILLRRLSSGGGGLDGVVHVVIDEVHERDINTDFLLVLVARLVRVAPNLRVTLMSATLNADLFAEHFGRVSSSRCVESLQYW